MNPVGYLETGVFYCDDNLRRLPRFPDESVDLIYLDPPFFSNKNYEVIWGDESEVRSFEDRWEGGIQHYVGWMGDRLVEMHRLLRDTGSLYLHCDPAASHYLKIHLDTIFGPRNFKNEIVWKRTSAHNDARRYGRVHDVILYYAKEAPKATFNRLYRPYEQAYLDAEWRQDDAGRWYKLENLTAPLRGSSGRFDFHGRTPGPTRMWRFDREGMDRLWEAGRIRTDAGGVPLLRGHIIYLDEMPGVPIQDWWDDILRVGNTAKERLGYPTQKPKALLERIIKVSSKEGDVVLDPFCGCGTTIAVAEHLGRKWIGIDISPTAVGIMERRLLKETNGAAEVRVEGLPITADDLRRLKPFEFQNWVVQQVCGDPLISVRLV